MRSSPRVAPKRDVAAVCLAWVTLLTVWPDPASAAPLFEQPTSYFVDGLPLAVRAGEFDLQAGLDLVTANQAGEDGPSLSFLINSGDGSFLPEMRVQLNQPQYILQALATGDFNDDGQSDVALAVHDVSVFPLRAVVLVYLGNGEGDFPAPALYPLNGFFPACLEAVDVSGDGILDLTACHTRSLGDTPIGVISVLTGSAMGGRPTGTFNAPVMFAVGTTPSTIAIGLLDDDEHSDIVVGEFDDGTIHILYGTGDAGLLSPAVVLGQVSSPSALAIADIDATDRTDILATSLLTDRLVTFSQIESRRFAAPESTLIALLPAAMRTADLSDDGSVDLVVVSDLGEDVLLGDGQGNFVFGEQLSPEKTLDDVILVDLNDDGQLDAVASSSMTDQVIVSLHVTPLGPGDANCDGKINNADVDALIGRLFAPGCSGADVNVDGIVSAADLPLMLQLLGGGELL